MKDKILLPAIFATLVLLVIFMLICIIYESSVIKNISLKIEELSGLITVLRTENMNLNRDLALARADINGSKTDIDRLKAEVASLNTAIVTIRTEIASLSSQIYEKIIR